MRIKWTFIFDLFTGNSAGADSFISSYIYTQYRQRPFSMKSALEYSCRIAGPCGNFQAFENVQSMDEVSQSGLIQPDVASEQEGIIEEEELMEEEEMIEQDVMVEEDAMVDEEDVVCKQDVMIVKDGTMEQVGRVVEVAVVEETVVGIANQYEDVSSPEYAKASDNMTQAG